MSSGFVSAGTNDQPLERDQEWHTAQKEIEENRWRKEEEAENYANQNGKSLYDVLQDNKGEATLYLSLCAYPLLLRSWPLIILGLLRSNSHIRLSLYALSAAILELDCVIVLHRVCELD